MLQNKFVSLLFACTFVSVLSACNNKLDLSENPCTTHTFDSFDNQLSARLYKPKLHSESDPIVIFVHGNGDKDSTENSFYLPIVDA
ncbi:hypothetical protein [Pseudoalteromonas umbrosa]|uniref:hypothetical protein n=1 Tax=Pseudoalteromonas umbrosa TaxID=3048489 RepID=UPI0024C23243|nr:hypothetical protein [Pseudoalteromonas sp. B95]MDK1286452.1 hypothetical protein [Pseudoalteromonas sp. B95]